MKKNMFWILVCLGCSGFAQKPVSIIFDTDIAPDYDDVGAMALLHAFADRGEAKLLATISCNTFETTGPTLSVLNTYFKRPDLPIGVTKAAFPNKDCRQRWAQDIIQHYPHALTSNDQAIDAVQLYRKILSGQPDHSVTIVTVGFFTNLANLMNSGPDKYSTLSGLALIRAKVTQLVSMAGNIGGYEFNVVVDAKASKKVFNEWPTPVILSAFEIGEKVLTGIRLIHNDQIRNSPVKDAFTVALTYDSNTVGRNSWDETAVLVAVRGIAPYFGSRKLSLDVMDDGKCVVVPGSKFTYLEFKQEPSAIATVIEDLMMHQPK